MITRLHVPRHRVATCALVAALTAELPVDFDEDGELDQFSWSGDALAITLNSSSTGSTSSSASPSGRP